MSIDRLILGIAGLAVRTFYRVSVEGEHVPATGPVVLVGNHPNGLVDPVLLSTATERSLRFLGKAPLFSMPLVGALVRGARVLPVHRPQDASDPGRDNEATFEAVHTALGAGDAIALFPEGKSHSEPKVQRMKTGAARMALGAEAQAEFRLGVRVVPVGLVYRARRRLGSRAVVWVGAPIEIDDLAAVYAEDAWRAVEVLTERITAGLRALTLELERWEELPLLEFVADLEAAPLHADFERVRRLARELVVARRRWPDEVLELREQAEEMRERLTAFGARPRDLAVSYTTLGVFRYVARHTARAALVLPLALLGRCLWFCPWQAVALLVRVARPTRDVWATTAVLGGLVLFPLWILAVAGLVGWYAGAALALGAAILLIASGLAALAGRGYARGLAHDIRAFRDALTKRDVRAHLAAERDELVRRIDRIRARAAAEA
ncbi:MAG: 1-acyl-sn-glycerol-3-phosphate acyltransferase [Planctomycetota bacterium]